MAGINWTELEKLARQLVNDDDCVQELMLLTLESGAQTQHDAESLVRRQSDTVRRTVYRDRHRAATSGDGFLWTAESPPEPTIDTSLCDLDDLRTVELSAELTERQMYRLGHSRADVREAKRRVLAAIEQAELEKRAGKVVCTPRVHWRRACQPRPEVIREVSGTSVRRMATRWRDSRNVFDRWHRPELKPAVERETTIPTVQVTR